MNKNINNNGNDASSLEPDWVFISPHFPPNINTANFSHAEQSGLADGRGGHESPYNQTTNAQQYEPTPLHFEAGKIAPSNTSTNVELNNIRCTEGIENEPRDLKVHGEAEPKIQFSNNNNIHGFLPVNAHMRRDELLVRRSIDFHTCYPYTLQAYLNSHEPTYATEFPSHHQHEHAHNLAGCRFLKQDPFYGKVNASIIAVQNQSSRRSKLSHRSMGEQNGDESWFAFHAVDPTLHAGGWVDRDGDMYETEYPMDMSVFEE